MRDSFLPFARPSLGEEEIREVVALGLWQLPRLDGFIQERAHLAARYDQAFADVTGLILPQRVPYPARHAWHL